MNEHKPHHLIKMLSELSEFQVNMVEYNETEYKHHLLFYAKKLIIANI